MRAQKEMLQRFEKTNEMLTNVNSLSAVRLEKVSKWMMLILFPLSQYFRPTTTLRSTLRML